MVKPTIYLDTTIFSAYCYHPKSPIAVVLRSKTRQWWDEERNHFDLYASSIVLQELTNGVYPWQDASVRMANRLRQLSITREIQELHLSLIDTGVVPPSKPGDAMQIAIATCHSIDYLLTWNYSHLANPTAQHKMEEVVKHLGYRPPLMVSPDTIPQVRFGHDLKRRF